MRQSAFACSRWGSFPNASTPSTRYRPQLPRMDLDEHVSIADPRRVWLRIVGGIESQSRYAGTPEILCAPWDRPLLGVGCTRTRLELHRQFRRGRFHAVRSRRIQTRLAVSMGSNPRCRGLGNAPAPWRALVASGACVNRWAAGLGRGQALLNALRVFLPPVIAPRVLAPWHDLAPLVWQCAIALPPPTRCRPIPR